MGQPSVWRLWDWPTSSGFKRSMNDECVISKAHKSAPHRVDVHSNLGITTRLSFDDSAPGRWSRTQRTEFVKIVQALFTDGSESTCRVEQWRGPGFE